MARVTEIEHYLANMVGFDNTEAEQSYYERKRLDEEDERAAEQATENDYYRRLNAREDAEVAFHVGEIETFESWDKMINDEGGEG